VSASSLPPDMTSSAMRIVAHPHAELAEETHSRGEREGEGGETPGSERCILVRSEREEGGAHSASCIVSSLGLGVRQRPNPLPIVRRAVRALVRCRYPDTTSGRRSDPGGFPGDPADLAFGQRVRAGGPSLRLLYGTGAGDRLGRLNDLLIGLTSREIGATVVTRNHEEFARIATVVPGLAVTAP